MKSILRSSLVFCVVSAVSLYSQATGQEVAQDLDELAHGIRWECDFASTVEWIEAGLDPDTESVEGRLLPLAAMCQDICTKNGTDDNCNDAYRMRSKIVNFLLRNGADPDLPRSDEGWSALMISVLMEDNIEVISDLLYFGGDPMLELGPYNTSALELALDDSGSVAELEELLGYVDEKTALVDDVSPLFYLALSRAECARGDARPGKVQILIDYGSLIETKLHDGFVASQYNYGGMTVAEVLEFRIRNAANSRTQRMDCFEKMLEVIQMKGAN